MALTKNKIRFIQSLDNKKDRTESGCFVAEGEKIVSELIDAGFTIEQLYGTQDWVGQYAQNIKTNIEIISKEDLKKISFLKTPNEVLCVASIPKHRLNLSEGNNKLSLLLDTVQDPGNMGTIIRIADWYGIEDIICTPESADAYNPKVVQATMGAICRVKVHYADFKSLMPEIQKLGIPILGTSLEGDNIYETELPLNGFIVMGNESKGVNAEWMKYTTSKLFIPNFPEGKKRSESLNVAVATAIVCAEMRRRQSAQTKLR
jgi:RNA methyltransferase, TrmH family